jgi:hypothetical protein
MRSILIGAALASRICYGAVKPPDVAERVERIEINTVIDHDRPWRTTLRQIIFWDESGHVREFRMLNQNAPCVYELNDVRPRCLSWVDDGSFFMVYSRHVTESVTAYDPEQADRQCGRNRRGLWQTKK